jgi:hypothetical protein
MDLIDLLEGSILCSFIQPLNMRGWNDLIIESHYEEKRDLDIRNAIYRRPVYTLDNVLEVGEQWENVVYHLRY